MTLSRRRLICALGAAPLMPALARAATGDEVVLLRDLYNRDMSFSDIALTNEGARITVQGFMAPPLRAESNFFVLTRRPMAVCPFCNDAADWPDDILAIYTSRVVQVMPFNVPIFVTGTLELGTYRDPELGFVSRVRLSDATYRRQ